MEKLGSLKIDIKKTKKHHHKRQIRQKSISSVLRGGRRTLYTFTLYTFHFFLLFTFYKNCLDFSHSHEIEQPWYPPDPLPVLQPEGNASEANLHDAGRSTEARGQTTAPRECFMSDGLQRTYRSLPERPPRPKYYINIHGMHAL
jgi:hypothetical protein